jgi:hypothetical protein
LLSLRRDDLLDAIGDVRPAAAAGGGRAEAPARTGANVCLDRSACQLGNRCAAPLGLVTKAGV